ncbi:MAG: Anaerobic glycerol-3-phosphate dehydrogenase subunit C [Chloroflexi bacterium ADurb.Bin325]|nr:MAG: Anaerobic glycerol-3-phosphate dehydrogenase subunit C [Chloroflexi bacterium ADurb.Bin325]
MTYTPELLEDIRRTADLCVKCNICTTACPVLPTTNLFPGPKYVGPQAQRFRDPTQPSPDHSLDYCSGCGVCTQVCPHGVKVMEINTAAKAEMRTERLRKTPLDPKLWRDTIFGYNEALGQVGGLVAPLTNFLMNFGPARMIAEKTLGIDHRAPLPRFHFRKFRGWFFGQHQREKAPTPPGAPKVAYFHGCATEHYEQSVGRAIVAVLEHNGFEVLLPEQNCCGLPMQSNGNFAGARRYANALLRKLAPYAGQGIPIVVGGTSCGLELKSDYREILGIHTAEARIVAEQVYDISEFLWLLHEGGRLKTDFRDQGGRYIPVHTSCHQKLHRIGRPALDLLGLVPGLTVEEMGIDCCGITGTYGYKHEKYDIAQQVGQPLFDKLRASGVDQAICDNETCRWNIARSSGLQVVHTMQVLAEAYGVAEG